MADHVPFAEEGRRWIRVAFDSRHVFHSNVVVVELREWNSLLLGANELAELGVPQVSIGRRPIRREAGETA
jgi:hypothetical protein